MEAETAECRVFPRDDDVIRWDADRGGHDIARRRSQFGSDDPAYASRECLRRRSDQPRTRKPQLPHSAFDENALQALYRNHGDYVSRFVQQANNLVYQGFWLQPEASDAIQRAVHANVP